MKLFSRYILGKFYKSLLVATAGFMFVFIIAGAMKRLDTFTSCHASIGQILTFLLYKSPQWFLQVFPISILLAQVVTVTELKRKNELIAVETSGVSMLGIMRPFLVSGLLFCLLIFITDEFAAIKTTHLASEYFNRVIKGEKRPSYWGKYFDTALQGKTADSKNSFFFLGYFDAVRQSGTNFSADTENGNGLKMIYAKNFAYRNGWVLRRVSERIWDRKENKVTEKYYALKKYNFPQKPEDFLLRQASYEDMNIFQLARHIKRLDEARVPSFRERVNFHSRISSSLSALVVLAIGLPVGLYFSSVPRAVSVVLSVFASFVYWGAFSLGLSFAENGMLPPWLGAWAANIFFISAAALFIKRKL